MKLFFVLWNFLFHIILYIRYFLFSLNRYLNCDPQFILRMLESFFKFVLLDPNVTVNWFTRQQFLTTLLQTASVILQCTGMSKFYWSVNLNSLFSSSINLYLYIFSIYWYPHILTIIYRFSYWSDSLLFKIRSTGHYCSKIKMWIPAQNVDTYDQLNKNELLNGVVINQQQSKFQPAKSTKYIKTSTTV